LPGHLAIPTQAESLQGPQDAVGASGDHALGIEVLHSQQPAAILLAGVEEASDGRYE
jgi:hypothetical protein